MCGLCVCVCVCVCDSVHAVLCVCDNKVSIHVSSYDQDGKLPSQQIICEQNCYPLITLQYPTKPEAPGE